MDSTLIETIRKNLGYRPLEKIDPNTQEGKHAKEISSDQRLAQAAIPTVLAAMIKYSDGEDGVHLFSDNADWPQTLFGKKEAEVIKKISDYSGVNTQETKSHIDSISAEAVKVVTATVKTPDAEKLRSFMNAQRHSVLSHLPAAMSIGDVLNENTFDDRTNKMEGPVSGFLHRIEDII